MTRLALLLVVAALLTAAPIAAQQAGDNPPMEGFDMAGSDAEAMAIADAVMAAMGGRENWDNTRYLSWGFGNDEQLWDKSTGDFRYQRDSLVVLMNINRREEGAAYADGVQIEDDEEIIAGAYRAWVNSGYWFMMPYKLKDSGVTLTYQGEGTTEDGRAADIVQLMFENVGLTPQNRYLVFVDKETRLVSQWQYFREAGDTEPGFTRPWANWKRYGTIMLSDNRGEGRGGDFVLPYVGVYESLPEGAFTDPNPLDFAALARTSM